MSREDPQMKIRLSESLRDRITASAEANRRSLNAEIVSRLEATFSGDKVLSAEQEALARDIAKDIMDRIETRWPKG